MNGILRTLVVIAVWMTAMRVLAADEAKGPSFPRIANVYGTMLTSDGARVSGETYSLAEVARCDLLIGVRGAGQGPAAQKVMKKQLDALQQLNPHLKGLRFACSAPYTHMKPNDEMMAKREAGQAFPWLLQTNGELIAGWPGTYMLNLAFPGVIEWLAQSTVPAVRDQGYDGVFIDCMGPHFDSWACEIATGLPYTVDHDGDGVDDDRKQLGEVWAQAKIALAHRTRELLGEEPIFMCNQAHESLADQLNGIYLEDYIDAVLDGRMDWEHVLTLYLKWTQSARQPNVTVLGCSSGVEPPFEGHKLSAEKQAEFFALGRPKLARMRFGLATTLMGDGYYSYDLHTRWRGQLWWYPEYDAPLGYPVEDCRRESDGTWRRRFEGGFVVVNPTDWDVVVQLRDAFCDVSSGRTGDRFVIPRQDGRIYVPLDVQLETGALVDPVENLSWEGPAGVVQRDGLVLIRDGNGMAALMNEAGGVESLCFEGDELVASVRSVVVQDDRWRNFDVSDCKMRVNADGALVFTGNREFDAQEIAYRKTVRLENGKCSIDYQWTASTPLKVRAFRHALHLSPRRFGNKVFSWQEGEVALPKKPSDAPNLARGIQVARLPVGNDRELVIQMPQSSQLVDDRFYRGSDFLLNFYPVAGDLPSGRQWNYSVTVTVE